MTDFEMGVRDLAEYLLRLAVDDEHEGDLACADVVRAAACFGVALEETQ